MLEQLKPLPYPMRYIDIHDIRLGDIIAFQDHPVVVHRFLPWHVPDLITIEAWNLETTALEKSIFHFTTICVIGFYWKREEAQAPQLISVEQSLPLEPRIPYIDRSQANSTVSGEKETVPLGSWTFRPLMWTTFPFTEWKVVRLLNLV